MTSTPPIQAPSGSAPSGASPDDASAAQPAAAPGAPAVPAPTPPNPGASEADPASRPPAGEAPSARAASATVEPSRVEPSRVEPSRPGAPGAGAASTAGPAPGAGAASPRDRAVDALLDLAAQGPYPAITLPEIAARAGLSLADLRDLFPSKGAILGAYVRRLDREVLEGTDPAMADEAPRERVLDVMLRRLDAMEPRKAALRSILEGVRGDAGALLALNGLALNSWRYMLASAGVEVEDELGLLRVQGAALLFARATSAWLDDDADLARTMGVLDRGLASGERALGYAEDARRLLAPLRGLLRSALAPRARPRRAAGWDDEPARGFEAPPRSPDPRARDDGFAASV